MWGLPQGAEKQIDNEALLQQLGGEKTSAPTMGATLGGMRQPTANTMPIREAPAPAMEDATVLGFGQEQQPPAAPLPQPPPPGDDDDNGIGALAGLFKGQPPMPPSPQTIGNTLKPQAIHNVLGPQAIHNALKPKSIGRALKNPLVALGGLFGRRR